MERCQHCRRRRGGVISGLDAAAALLLAVAGCSPIEAYRHWIGISANDPNPATTPNTKNLLAGDARSYPNLATVPPPPSGELTTAELDKLTQSLIAERSRAKDVSEHFNTPTANTGPPPPLPPPPLEPPGLAAPGQPPQAGPPPATSNPAAPKPAAPPAGTAKVAAAGAAAKSGRTFEPFDQGKTKQPPEPGPMESSLQPPQIAPLPQAEAARPAPPPPRELSLPAGGAAAPAGQVAHLPPAPPTPPLPSALASANFQPAPPPPQLPPPAPVRTAKTETGKPAKPAPPVPSFAKIGDIEFAGAATALSEADRQTLERIAARYRARPGAVRVVGYAGMGGSGNEQLDAYRTALTRAEAVAAGLRQAGIPAAKIAVEAAPADSSSGPGHAEILFAQ